MRPPARVSPGRDAIVIGAGLVGAALAWGLARAGASVVLLDEGDLAWRAARGNFGLIWVQSKGLGVPEYQRWTRWSAEHWPELAAQLAAESGVDVRHERPGGLTLCLSEQEYGERERYMERLRREAGEFGFEYRMLRRPALDALIPGLGPAVVGASWTGYDGHVNPLRLLRALHAAFLARGGDYRPNCAATRVEPGPGALTVHAGGERWTAPRVVLAAGLGNRALAAQVGLDCPVTPNRGHILVTEPIRPLLPMPTVHLRQTDEGALLIGSSQEDAGFDDRVDTGVLRGIARRAIDAFPFVAGLRIVRAWAALRVMTPDGLPLYQRSPACPGLYCVACHSGVTLAAAHALRVAPALLDDHLPPELARFSAARFGSGIAPAGAAA